MRLQIVALVALIGLACIPLTSAQTAAPNEAPATASPSPAKHRGHKANASPTPAADSSTTSSNATTAAASPSATKHRGRKKAEATAAESPAPATSAATPAASPAAKTRGHKKAATSEPATSTPAAVPPAAAASPVASVTPRPNILGQFFHKPAATPVPAAASTPAKPASEEMAKATPAAGGGHGMVWVNTESHVFHREGSRYYGKTKQGKYMAEDDAIKAGYRPPAKGQ